MCFLMSTKGPKQDSKNVLLNVNQMSYTGQQKYVAYCQPKGLNRIAKMCYLMSTKGPKQD